MNVYGPIRGTKGSSVEGQVVNHTGLSMYTYISVGLSLKSKIRSQGKPDGGILAMMTQRFCSLAFGAQVRFLSFVHF